MIWSCIPLLFFGFALGVLIAGILKDRDDDGPPPPDSRDWFKYS